MFKIDEPSNINTIFGGVQETTRKKRVKKNKYSNLCKARTECGEG